MKSKCFKLVGIVPGVVHTRRFGSIDFSKEVPETILKELHDDGFPYLELTEAGENKLNKNQKEKSPDK